METSISARRRETYYLSILVLLNLLIKIIPAAILELGNDEVYYWTYALFPDWSHFDHPPMVGLLIQLFTFNLHLHGEFFIRLGALILSSASIFILFYLVKRVFSSRAAWFAVIMFISSFYFNIISGLFMLPDTPQVFFVVLALYFLLPSVTSPNPGRKEISNFILFGFFTGLAFLSKYHSLFLWAGAGLYILIKNRIWLKKPGFYLSIIVTLILMIPVFYWNYKNNFISFTFHENRVGLFHSHINPVSFSQFNFGEMFYQNPVLFVLFIIATIRILIKKKPDINQADILLLITGIPLIVIFTLFSLFHTTLPHWTGPAFICFIIITAEYLANMYNLKRKAVIRILSLALILFVAVLVTGTLQIETGFISIGKNQKYDHTGKNDFTLDMYGWKQAREGFEDYLSREGISKGSLKNTVIISDNWFPAAHIDYYIAYPLGIRLIALGNIERIHKYYWIDRRRGLKKTDRIFYITDSRNFHSPDQFRSCFSSIIPADTIVINRNKKPVKYIYIYKMNDFSCDSIPNSPHVFF